MSTYKFCGSKCPPGSAAYEPDDQGDQHKVYNTAVNLAVDLEQFE